MAISFASVALAAALFCILSAGSRYAQKNDDQVDRTNLPGKVESSLRVEEDATWSGFTHLGQVSAVAVDNDGNLHLFHRGDRVWDSHTFDQDYKLYDTAQGPIPNDTVIVFDTINNKVLYSWGANRFYIPHGLTIDKDGNSYVTDTGLHQVLRFPPREDSPDLVLGEHLIPGHDISHFCQPTDIAVVPGYFFVSDGYCNSRILKFTKAGRLVQVIGSKDGMFVPHCLTLVPKHNAVCVADRENGRVFCYATGMGESASGTKLGLLERKGLGRVFAIDRRGKQLFAVNGPDLFESQQSVASDHGLVFDLESGKRIKIWGPEKGFRLPHDISVSPDGKYVYISESDINAPKRVYRFIISD